jgi:hypothetical protein
MLAKTPNELLGISLTEWTAGRGQRLAIRRWRPATRT